ncbi:hypothetical protein QAD02_009341 [Eretmocerus hayati]|uniref:Uncharacterized protein n=1 Tax=Eretmocerus hayati TaxID=131215 RepID=A0ACC2N9T2_9HYME|nr:hypothetical protein QAD02_009341 [Eretmocerus hayati]
MVPATKVLVILVMFIFTLGMSAIVKKRTFTRQIIFEEIPEMQIENTTLWYVTCSSVSANQKNCRITIETSDFGNVTHSRKCDTVLTSTAQGVVSSRIRIYAFGLNKALLYWAEKEKRMVNEISNGRLLLNFRTIHFLDSCSFSEAQIATEGSEMFDSTIAKTVVVTHRDTFAVIYPNQTSCGDRWCKITFDSQGRNLEGSVPFLVANLKESIYSHPMETRSGNQYFFAEVKKWDFNVDFWLSDSVGKMILLDSLSKINEKTFGDSTSNGLAGWCYIQLSRRNTTICSQYDARGDARMKQVSLDHGQNVELMKPYNLRDGGMLMITGRQKTSWLYHLYLTKQDANGKFYKPVEITGYECPYFVNDYTCYQIFENNFGEYCVALPCFKKKFQLFVQCFPQKSLTLR